jgi:hypothetical protein
MPRISDLGIAVPRDGVTTYVPVEIDDDTLPPEDRTGRMDISRIAPSIGLFDELDTPQILAGTDIVRLEMFGAIANDGNLGVANSAAWTALFAEVQDVVPHIATRAGVTYYMASTLIPPRRCVFEGDGAGMEALVTSHTTFSFPSGVNGFQINSNDAAGSIVKRIKVVMQGGAFGGNHARVMEYVSGTGELLILPPTISMPFNVEQDMSWRNFRTLDVSQGTFHWPGWVADAYGRDPTAPVVGRWAKGTIVGTFTANEVITESGGTQVLVGGVLVNKSARFFYQLNDKVVGHTPNAVWNWTPGATLTGQTSGATIVVNNTGVQRDDAYFANVRILSYWQKTGTAFVAGDLVYGTTSGTTGHVWFKSERFNLLILDGVIGQDDDDTDTVTTQAFQIGETVQTAGGAKTAVVSRSRTTSRNFRKAVVSAKSYTGTVDLGGKDTETERVNQGICRSNHFGHAFLLNRRAYLEDCVAFGWSGDGILISSSSAEGGTAGNANLTRIHRFKSSYCMNGARTVGTDGDNAGSFTHCTFNLSSGWHALSRSFYGEEWEVCHGANAMTGTWHSGYNSVRQSAFVNCYDEAAPDLGEYEPVQAMLSGYSHRDGGVWGNPVELADFTSNVGRGGSSQHADFGLRTPTIELDSVTHAQTHKTVGTFNTVQRYRASAEGGETAVWLDFLTTYASGKNGPFDKDGGALMGRIAFLDTSNVPSAAVRMRAALSGALTLGSVGGGTGARIFAEVDSGGLVTAVNVMSEGTGYASGTTATLSGSTATFALNIQDGRIVGAAALTAGTGGTRNDIRDALVMEMTSTSAGVIRPGIDNFFTLGNASYRAKEIFSANATINTSDARTKTDIEPLTGVELAAAKALAAEFGTYKFLAAIEEKGDAARTHVGMTVQRAIEIMDAHNLDPFAYSFICHDAWEDSPARYETVEVSPPVADAEGTIIEPAVTEQRMVADVGDDQAAGEIYSFRYTELQNFILRGFEARLAALESA